MPRPVEVLQKAHIEKSLTTASGATVTLTGVTMTLTGVVSHGSSYNNSSIANLTALVATGASSLGGRLNVSTTAHFGGAFTVSGGVTLNSGATIVGPVSLAGTFNNSSLANLTAIIGTGPVSLAGHIVATSGATIVGPVSLAGTLNSSSLANLTAIIGTGPVSLAGHIVASSGATVAGTMSLAGVIDARSTMRLSGAPFVLRSQSLATQWAGFVVMNSGDAAGTVSTTTVKSDSLILASCFSNTASNNGNRVVIHSRTEGSYFGFTVEPTPVGTDFTVGYVIFNTASL